MTLADYMKHHSISADDLAARIGDVSASGVRKWKYGERIPRPDQMRRIMEITAGAVSPNDFILTARSDFSLAEARA